MIIAKLRKKWSRCTESPPYQEQGNIDKEDIKELDKVKKTNMGRGLSF
jgi:hypothetical protein